MAGVLVPITKSGVELATDPAQYVVQACERAKAWLADALEHGDIEQIVELKSQAEAIRVYTAQKQLGKDTELSAAEIVRRAERGIGLAIRRGQEVGEIRRRGQQVVPANQHRRAEQGVNRNCAPSPYEFASPDELHGNGSGIYHMTDGVTDQQFDAAINDGKAEGNLSRANVVRKARAGSAVRSGKVTVVAADEGEWIPATNDRSPKAAARRRELIRDLAGKAWTSRQIGQHLQIRPGSVREIAQKEDIAIPADTVVGLRTRTAVDSNRIVRETVNSVEGLEIALDLVLFDELDRTEIQNWITSLTASIRVLNRLNKQLKEMIQ